MTKHKQTEARDLFLDIVKYRPSLDGLYEYIEYEFNYLLDLRQDIRGGIRRFENDET